jgi:GT2 family glycosyltransferase
MNARLTIQLLGWNGARFLQETASALSKIPSGEVIIRYIDNGSEDASLEIVRDLLPHADIIRMEKNIGFASAHNKGFAVCTTPFVLTLDQDITVIWEGLRALLQELENSPKLGAAQGKLYRTVGKKILDSAGIVQTLALNGKERGANEKDTGQYETKTDLFATTGGCAIYRMEAIKGVAYKNEIFDEDFFAYKEDVDLGWRLHKAGWKVQYIPVLVGYHARTMGKRGIFNWGIKPGVVAERIANNRTKLSLRNYIWMLAKNMTFTDELKHDLFIAIRLFIFFILSLFSSKLFSAWKEAFAGIHRMHDKRK